MISYNYIRLFCVLLLAITLNSCKTNKQATSSSSNNALNDQQQIKFSYYFVEGCKERMKGNMELAENYFKECLKLDPTSIAVKYELGNVYRYNGLYDLAINYAKVCANSDIKNEWYQMLYIECLHNRRQYNDAADVYSRLIKNYPYRAEFYEGLAGEQMYAGNYEKSFKTYDELEKKFGQNEAFTLNKIKLLKQLRKTNEAELEFKNLIKFNPSEIRYYTYLAEFYQETNQPTKAMETYQQALQKEPNNPMVHLALADYYKLQNDKENFYKEIKTAFENPELEPETKTKILISFFQLAETDPNFSKQANELLDITLRLHPTSAEAHAFKADVLYRDKKFAEAKTEYEKSISLDKNKFSIWTQLLYLESEQNDNISLEKHSAEAMELFPNQAAPYYFNGVANMQLKQYAKAIEAFNEGVEFVYDNNPLLLQFYSNLGESYNAIKNYEKSDKAFDNALKVDPDNAFILNNYGYYLSLRKTTLERAEKFSRRSNELSPNNRSYIDTYGWILYQLGKYKDAETWLSRAAKMGSPNAVITEHYGDVLYKLDKKEEALQYWKEAKLAGEGSEFLNKKIADKKLYE